MEATGSHDTKQGQPTEEEQDQDQPEMAEEEVDVQALVAAALTRITDAAAPPLTTEATEEEDQRRWSDEAQDAGAGRGAGDRGGEGGA